MMIRGTQHLSSIETETHRDDTRNEKKGVGGRNTRVQSGGVVRRTAWRAHRTPTGEIARGRARTM